MFMSEPFQWQYQPVFELPEEFVEAVQPFVAGSSGHYAAQLLWQRGIRDRQQLAGFLDPGCYQPTSPFAFGQEMQWAIERILTAWQRKEKVAIWGDFDADGITATAVLWEGLGQFFPQLQLTYYIPNRLSESHGLSAAGLEELARWGCDLIITCDTGSTSLKEILYARALGIETIVTDHHTLPHFQNYPVEKHRPPVVAIINPRYLPADHPLAHLSGVAVAYKLIEALYQTQPDVPQQPLENLLDLVAIGLIADLVTLTGDCRYLAQRGIEQLQRNQGEKAPRPGIARLLALCRKSGDRPTDISFGLGPRINAISRIQGDARFCVELLTSQDQEQCSTLAEETELANFRRRALQRDVMRQIKAKLEQLDLSTTGVIVLSDPQWPVGILGLVAGQIAQEYGRPTILLSIETERGEEANADRPMASLAKGSARSTGQIDLYQLMQNQSHLLHSFGGHPFAAGLSLPVENIGLLAEGLNRQLRQQPGWEGTTKSPVQVDLTVTVDDLNLEAGKALFSELRVLEPCGMGNPAAKLLIKNCWFTNLWHRKIKATGGDQEGYIKAEFMMWDDSSDRGFPGIWWGHYKDEIPVGRCNAIVELDFNSYEDAKRKKRYELRLIAVRPAANLSTKANPSCLSADWIVDWRGSPLPRPAADILQVTDCPCSWAELQVWISQAVQTQQKLAIAYPPPVVRSPQEIWEQLIGLAKYLSRTGKSVTRSQLRQKLEMGEQVLEVSLNSLKDLGFAFTATADLYAQWRLADQEKAIPEREQQAKTLFIAAVQEEQFHRQYFYEVPLVTIQSAASQMIGSVDA